MVLEMQMGKNACLRMQLLNVNNEIVNLILKFAKLILHL